MERGARIEYPVGTVGYQRIIVIVVGAILRKEGSVRRAGTLDRRQAQAVDEGADDARVDHSVVVVVLPGIRGRQIDGEPLRGQRADREASVLAVITVVAAHRVDVFQRAVALLDLGCKAHQQQSGNDRHVDHALEVGGIEARIVHRAFRFVLIHGLLGRNADHPRLGVSAEESALRALENLDAVDVDQVRVYRRIVDVEVIQVDTERVGGPANVADASNRKPQARSWRTRDRRGRARP